VRRIVALLLAALLVNPGVAAAGPVSSLPAGLTWLPPGTLQLLVVSSAGYGSTSATLTAYTHSNGGWRMAFPGLPARIGARGFSDRKHEGDRTTPTGIYAIGPTMYGLRANPGVHYPYHVLVPGDYWNENPISAGYNTFSHGANPGGPSEALWRIAPQYDSFAVIMYNIPFVPSLPARGSGVFLHVMVPGHATAGCVSLARADLVRILTWLNPGAGPRIVMGPASRLSQY
jgi:L,D-peptidoglycan transpeptidase YkuD (ErfK/YbiS/YcfS/YnhG family)